MARKGKKGLSPDDREIWARVAQSARPMHPKRPGISHVPSPLTKDGDKKKEADRQSATAMPIAPFRIGSAAGARGQALPQTSPAPHAPVRMDMSAHRKLVRGKLKPDARIDLHGMTLAQAHPALIGFVSNAYDRGHRLVLVITGKGRDGDDGGPIPVRRGVLRQQVPHWLTAPPLGAVVLEIREAHARHGGGGAYYVYLKRRR